MKRFIAMLVVMGLVAVFAGCGSTDEQKAQTQLSTAVSQVQQAIDALPSSGDSPSSTELPSFGGLDTTTTATENPSGHWVAVATLTGSARKEGEDFTLTGAPAKLTYTVDATDYSIGIYVLESGTNLDTDGGVATLLDIGNGGGSGETMIHKSAGRYYLVVDSEFKYAVTVWEKR